MRNAILNIPEMLARIQAFGGLREVQNFASSCQTVRKYVKATLKTRWSNAMTQRPSPEQEFTDRDQLVAAVQPEVKVGQVVEVWDQVNVRSKYTPHAVYIVKAIKPKSRTFVPEEGFGPQNGWYSCIQFGVEMRLLMQYRNDEGQQHNSKPSSWKDKWNGKENQLFWNPTVNTNQLQNIIDMPGCHVHIVESFEDYVLDWKAFYRTAVPARAWNNQNEGPNLPKWIIKLAGKVKHLIPNA